MRRFALTLLASLSVVVLTACNNGNGGTGIGSGDNNPSFVFFTNGSGTYESVFKVAPGTTTPLLVTAVGVKSNMATIQAGMTVTWNATYSNATYQNPNNSTGVTTQTACPAVPPTGTNAATGALVMQRAPTGAYATYVASTPTNTIGILPSNLGTPAATAPAAPYCLLIIATANNGVVGTFIAAVTN